MQKFNYRPQKNSMTVDINSTTSTVPKTGTKLKSHKDRTQMRCFQGFPADSLDQKKERISRKSSMRPSLDTKFPGDPQNSGLSSNHPKGNRIRRKFKGNRRPESNLNESQPTDPSHSSSVVTPLCQSVLDRDRLFCPICVEKFDELELRFTPCPCGFRVCSMCIHLIKEKADGKCPNCRDEYLAERGHLSAEIGKEMKHLLAEARRLEDSDVRCIRLPTSKSKKTVYAQPQHSGNHIKTFKKPCKVVPLVVASPQRTVPVEPVTKLTRFTGGMSVWD